MIQTLLVASAAGLSALYFIKQALGELGIGRKVAGGSCHGCNPTRCPAARQD